MKTLYLSLFLFCSLITTNVFAQDPIAVNDSVSISNFQSLLIDVLDNDYLGEETFYVSVYYEPYSGYAHVQEQGNAIVYTPFLPVEGEEVCTCFDTFVYALCPDPECFEVFSMAEVHLIWDESGVEYVWPGDTNSDGLANVRDLLPIGQHYGAEGPIRYLDGGIDWEAQNGADWTESTAEDINLKHLDCNGDGYVNEEDVAAISENYGLTHDKTGAEDEIQFEGSIYIDILNETVAESDSVTAVINLGDAVIPLEGAYGLAFSIEYDEDLIEDASIEVNFTESWLSSGSPILQIYKELDARTDAAVSRTDQISAGGYGPIGVMTFVMEDVLIGKDQSAELNLQITDVRLVSADNTEIEIEAVGDEVNVVGNQGPPSLSQEVMLWPNPVQDHFQLRFEYPVTLDQLKLTDCTGKIVWQQTLGLERQLIDVRLPALAAGTYLLDGVSQEGTFQEKLVITQ